jgi:hypothetical protein
MSNTCFAIARVRPGTSPGTPDLSQDLIERSFLPDKSGVPATLSISERGSVSMHPDRSGTIKSGCECALLPVASSH